MVNTKDTITWNITGYIGFSDYDSPEDNNINLQMEMDESVTKEELEILLLHRYKKYRVVVLECKKAPNNVKSSGYLHMGLFDKNGIEAKPGDTIQIKHGGKVFIEEFGSRIIGAFTYRPVGATNSGSSYILEELKRAEIEIIGR